MLKVKLREEYQQEYWDSANGVTIPRFEQDRKTLAVREVDEENQFVRHALDSGILEVVNEEKDKLNIINDTPTKDTIKEIVTPKAVEENKATLEKIKTESAKKEEEKKEENAIPKSSNQADKPSNV